MALNITRARTANRVGKGSHQLPLPVALLIGWLLLSSLAACSHVGAHQDNTTTRPDPPVANDEDIQPASGKPALPSLAELMDRRQSLCTIAMDDRLRLLSLYRGYFIEGDQTLSLPGYRTDRNHQLDALLLSSCSPARTPGILGEMLSYMTSDEEWSQDYQEFLDLMTAYQHAYNLMESRNRELHETVQELESELQSAEKQYQALKAEHEKTIRGISEIERGME